VLFRPFRAGTSVVYEFVPRAMPWADLWMPLRGGGKQRNIKKRKRGLPRLTRGIGTGMSPSLALRVGVLWPCWGGEKLGLTTVSLAPVPIGFCCAIWRRLLCAGLLTPHERLTEGLLPSERAL